MLKQSGLTQAEIGDVLEVTRKVISDYAMLINNIAPQVLDLCRTHQEGRGALNAPIGTIFNFTEGWFRNSGLEHTVAHLGQHHL